MFSANRVASVAIIVAFQFVPNASAEHTVAMLHVSAARSFSDGNRETEAEYDRYFQTQLVLLRSPAVLNTALKSVREKSPELVSSWSLASLTGSLRAKRLENSEIIQATLQPAGSGKPSPIILDAIVDAYLDYLRNLETVELAARIELPADGGPSDAEIQAKAEIINRLAEELGSSDDDMIQLRVGLEQDRLRQLARQREAIRNALSQLTADQIASELAGDMENQIERMSERLAAAEQEYNEKLERVSNLTGFAKDLVARKADWHALIARKKQRTALRQAPLRVSCIQRAIVLD